MTTVKHAEKAFETARTTVRQWTNKARDARSEAAEHDAGAGAAILSGSSANDIAVKINAADLQARAFAQAATEAEKQVKVARRELLEAWIAQYDRDATEAKQERDDHKTKVDALLVQLKELDGWDYKPVDAPTEVGSSYAIARSAHLHAQWRKALNQAAYCRYSLAEEKYPTGALNLREHGGDVAWYEDMGDVISSSPRAAVEYLAALDPQQAFRVAPAKDIDDELDPMDDADIMAAAGGTQ